MDLKTLRRQLDRLSESLRHEDKSLLKARLEGLLSVFPFSDYDYIFSFLIDRGVISFADYEQLRETYVDANRYLNLFGLAPRIFGQVWGEKHLMDLDERLQKPSRELDPDYEGQYDLWLDGVRVEVKAARAINTKKRGDLVSKALRFESSSPFWMNFQQLKLDICDVFVFIGVWVDKIVYWVLSNEEVRASKFRTHQHRGGVEYQIGVTDKNIHEFTLYITDAASLIHTVLRKGQTTP